MLFGKRYIRKLKTIYIKKGYKTIPYISEENAYFVIKQHDASFNFLVPKEYMKTFKVKGHTILRGHIILLWWLNNSRASKKKIPKYFERQYGIDAKSEIETLKEYGWISDDGKLTKAGKEVLEKYNEIVRQHRATKSFNFDGSISYDYSRILKGKEKEKERLRHVLEHFDESIANAEKDGYLLQWLVYEDDQLCSTCKSIAEKDSGFGKGIYTPEQAKKIRNKIHWDCRCCWTPYIK